MFLNDDWFLAFLEFEDMPTIYIGLVAAALILIAQCRYVLT
jgi:hypothetical protein